MNLIEVNHEGIKEEFVSLLPYMRLARDIHLYWASRPELYKKYPISSRKWDIAWAKIYQKYIDLVEKWK